MLLLLSGSRLRAEEFARTTEEGTVHARATLLNFSAEILVVARVVVVQLPLPNRISSRIVSPR